MGKRIIQQRRGRGTNTYKAKKTSFIYRLKYPKNIEGEGIVQKLINSSAHTAPLAKIKYKEGIFYIPAFQNMIESQKIIFNKEIKEGNILELKDIPVKTKIYCVESRPGDGGVFIKTAGSSGFVSRVVGEEIFVLMPSKKEKKFNKKCRAVIGTISGAGRLEKPVIKAGKMFYIKRAKNKLYPRTSALKMNVIDHPFG